MMHSILIGGIILAAVIAILLTVAVLYCMALNREDDPLEPVEDLEQFDDEEVTIEKLDYS